MSWFSAVDSTFSHVETRLAASLQLEAHMHRELLEEPWVLDAAGEMVVTAARRDRVGGAGWDARNAGCCAVGNVIPPGGRLEPG